MEIIEQKKDVKARVVKEKKIVEPKNPEIKEPEQEPKNGVIKLAPKMKDIGGTAKTFLTRHKKGFIIGALAVLLCITGYLNFTLNYDNSYSAGAGLETSRINIIRNLRADERTRDILVYENLIATSTNADTVATAERKLLELRENVQFETAAEGLILGENYDDVIVNRANGFVNVILKRTEEIDRIQAVKIMTLLRTIQSDLDIDNVYISLME